MSVFGLVVGSLLSASSMPAARVEDALCVKVSGLPTQHAAIIKSRIEENASRLRGVQINTKADCSPNAFIGFVKDVDETVETLEEEQEWLFKNLSSHEVDRIQASSSSVRAWHRLERRNVDGTDLPGERFVGEGNTQFINQTQVATRFDKEQVNILAGVVLIEAGAVKDKTLRQIADYSTVRLLASVDDDVEGSSDTPATILTLFRDEAAPASITSFDFAFLEALYDLPATARGGTVLAAAHRRFEERQQASPAG